MKRRMIFAISALIATGAAYGQSAGYSFVVLKASADEATMPKSRDVARSRLAEQCKRDYQGGVVKYSKPSWLKYSDAGAEVLAVCSYPGLQPADENYGYEPLEAVGALVFSFQERPVPDTPNLALPKALDDLRQQCQRYDGELVSQGEPILQTNAYGHLATVRAVCKHSRL